LATDHLYCLAAGCKTQHVNCNAGESCLGLSLSFGSDIDELCVPSCDLDKACPPGFTCLRNARWAPGSTPLCFPGLIGTRCATQQDCLLGACTDVGVEFDVCTIPCTKNEECAALNSATDIYFCSTGRCLTPRPFQGSNCTEDAHCIAGQRCLGKTPVGVLSHGECRIPCDADGQCPARGGLPHVCLGKDHEGGCYPSSFALPCATQADCVGNFQCLAAGPDPRSLTDYSPSICTIPCSTDADCDANTWTKKSGFCRDGICRLAGGIQATCDRNAQCASDRCEAMGSDISKTCVPAFTL
jgi:hypothetical protein